MTTFYNLVRWIKVLGSMSYAFTYPALSDYLNMALCERL